MTSLTYHSGNGCSSLTSRSGDGELGVPTLTPTVSEATWMGPIMAIFGPRVFLFVAQAEARVVIYWGDARPLQNQTGGDSKLISSAFQRVWGASGH